MYGYNERKAAQVAAYFALRAGGTINILKLAKLLYLAERMSMQEFDEPMFYDRLVSMDHGPVTSMSLNHVNGLSESEHWPQFVARAGYDVGAASGLSLEGLDELSKADVRLLEKLWGQFGPLSQYELREWTHQYCPEWENPHGSSDPIPHDRVFKFLGKQNADSLAEAVLTYRTISRTLDTAC